MTYESWRISYQSSEQAARAAYDCIAELKSVVAEAGKQQAVAYADKFGNVITKATKDFSRNVLTNAFDKPLYAHPDYASAARVMVLESRNIWLEGYTEDLVAQNNIFDQLGGELLAALKVMLDAADNLIGDPDKMFRAKKQARTVVATIEKSGAR